MNKIRILLLITDLEIGGAPLVVKQLACGLDQDPFDVHVVCLAPDGPIAQELRQAGITVYPLGARSPWDIRVFFRLAHLIRRLRPQILQTTLIHANFAGRVIGSLFGVPHILAAIHTIEKNKRWHLTLENLTCRLSEKTICIAESVARHVHQDCHVPLSRLHTIPNGVDIDHFANAATTPLIDINLDPSRKTLLYLGRLDPIKGIDLLLNALARLISQFDLQLIIAGDGPEKQKLIQLSDQLKLVDRVRFLGSRRDTAGLLKASDILILPSYTEGLPLVLLEAMAAGIPIIASRTEGTCQIITHKTTGLLFDTGCFENLAKNIESLLENPHLSEKIIRAAYKMAKNRHSHHHMVIQYIDLYKSL